MMGKNISIFKRHCRIPLVSLCLSFLFLLSCGFNSPKSVSSTSHPPKKSEPEMVVQKFMDYIAENKIEEANQLIISEKERSKDLHPNQEIPAKFDWAKTFADRKVSLKKIVESKIFDNNAKVNATVIYDNDNRIDMTTIFDLKNVDGQWFIYDIDFITDKNQVPDKL